jgi:AICAR transformylase/IMP cyclohydrolase PurH
MRALLSVYDKTGVVELARGLADLGWELVSSGGTSAALRDAGLDVITVESVTGSPEMLGDRVKTLHPLVHAGILADTRKPDHVEQLAELGVAAFDLVVVNLYPFADTGSHACALACASATSSPTAMPQGFACLMIATVGWSPWSWAARTAASASTSLL